MNLNARNRFITSCCITLWEISEVGFQTGVGFLFLIRLNIYVSMLNVGKCNYFSVYYFGCIVLYIWVVSNAVTSNFYSGI